MRSTAAIGGGLAVVGSDDGGVYGLALKDGTKRWRFDAGAAVEAPVALSSQRVYVGATDGHFHCLEQTTGAPLWKVSTAGKIIGGASVVPATQGQPERVVFGSFDNKLRCLDARTGSVLWTYETSDSVNATPALSGDQLVVGGCDGFVHVMALSDGSSAQRWPVGSHVGSTLAIADGVAYFGHFGKEVVAMELATGLSRWTYRDRSFAYLSSAAVDGELAVLGGRDRQVHAISRKTGEAWWVFSARGKVDSSPVIWGNRVVVGSHDGRVYLLDREDGTVVWSDDLGAPVTASPAIAEERVVIGAQDGSVMAYVPVEVP